MAGLKLQGFAGFVPRQSPYLLQDNEAQIAINSKLYSGEVRSWQKPGILDPRRAFTQFVPASMYRTVNQYGDDMWLTWADDVDVVPGPIYDVGGPLYYTGAGDGKPKKTNSTIGNTGVSGIEPTYPGDYLLMGVPNPTATLSVSASGGSTGSGAVAENRVYLFTYLSQFGSIVEESGPSPASAQVTVNPGGTVSVTGLPSAAPTGKYNITKVRIYRSVTGTNSTVFLKVADVDIGTTSYSDTVSATSLGGTLQSNTWEPPPDGLRGLVAMANGIMAGFVGNQIYFSEPYFPHAWPSIYALTVEYQIVGIAAIGTSLVVATKGNPFVISGSNPAGMSQEKLPLYEPCVSKRSIASDEQGAMYASPNGIIKIGAGIADNVSRGLFTRDEWDLYKPSSMLGEVQDGRYFLFYKTDDGVQGGLILDRNQAASPLTETNLFATAAHTDPVNARLYVCSDSEIKAWDADPYNGLPYEWKSKVFVFPRPLNLSAGQIDADFENLNPVGKKQKLSIIDFIKEKNREIWATVVGKLKGNVNDIPVNTMLLNGSLLQPIPLIDEKFVTLKVFADGILRATIFVKSHEPFRLPSGYKADRYEFMVNGNVPLRFIKVAETSKELVSI
jgi:hypothetical protein